MESLLDIPVAVRAGAAAALALVALVLVVVRRRRAATAKPADAQSPGERKRRRRGSPDAAVPRRRRRKLAAEAAHAIGPTDDPAPAAAAPPVEVPAVEVPPVTVPAPEPIQGVTAVDLAADDPYVTASATAGLIVDDASVVAQPGWPSPGELASGFDPDAFDPLPVDANDEVPQAMVDVQAELADVAEIIELADFGGNEVGWNPPSPAPPPALAVVEETWSDVEDDFDPATGWGDHADATAHEPPPVPVMDDATAELRVIAADDAPSPQADDEEWDETWQDEPEAGEVASDDEQEDWEDDVAVEPEAPVSEEPGPDWDEGDDAWDDADEATIDESMADADEVETVPVAEADWDEPDVLVVDDAQDEGWDAPDPGLAVPFPLPGSLPAHPDATGALIAPADVLPGSPIVIDLANLVASGERVELVIEPGDDGTGVRLRFGGGARLVEQAPTDDASAATDVTPDGDAAADPESTAPADAPWEPVDVTEPAEAPEALDPVSAPAGLAELPAPAADADEGVVAARDDEAAPSREPVGVAAAGATVDLAADDPVRILADIRARLAALDTRRTGETREH